MPIIKRNQKLLSWPEGKRAALTLSFDDGRLSQVDQGIPLLDQYGVKASFYICPHAAEQRLEDWKKAIKKGHEIGNHTVHHPCSGNFEWSRKHALEDYTLKKMEAELLEANEWARKKLGVTPQTFAYCCGQTFVGRGKNVKSFVPLVAKHFVSGRGFRAENYNDPYFYTAGSENHNDPSFCDLSQTWGISFDNTPFEIWEPILKNTVVKGGWLILGGHEIGAGGSQTTLLATLEKICKFAKDPANGIWVGTVASIAKYIHAHRKKILWEKLAR